MIKTGRPCNARTTRWYDAAAAPWLLPHLRASRLPQRIAGPLSSFDREAECTGTQAIKRDSAGIIPGDREQVPAAYAVISRRSASPEVSQNLAYAPPPARGVRTRTCETPRPAAMWLRRCVTSSHGWPSSDGVKWRSGRLTTPRWLHATGGPVLERGRCRRWPDRPGGGVLEGLLLR